VRILPHCRTAITPDGTLRVIEMTIPDDDHPSPGQLCDLNMLVMTGGQERTASEYVVAIPPPYPTNYYWKASNFHCLTLHFGHFE
jgi:hypothetical protein